MAGCEEALRKKDEECKEALRFYEQRWLEDWELWQKERRELLEAVQRLLEEAQDLKRVLAQREAELSGLRLRLEERERALARAKAFLRRPLLGEGFFRRLEAHLDLLDETLLQEAREWTVQEVGRTLGALEEERRAALKSLFSGGAPDWRRLWTGLLLEWALWAWLEGGDG